MLDPSLPVDRDESKPPARILGDTVVNATTMQDYIAAAKLLEPLCKQEDGSSSPHLESAVARIYLQGGHIEMAVKHFSAVVQDKDADASLKTMNAALLASAEGDWEKANQAFKQLLQIEPENFAVRASTF